MNKEQANIDVAAKREQPDQLPNKPDNHAASRLEFHPLANLFQLMEEEDLGKLAQNIGERGLLEPIVLYENKILDGRNRYLACERVQVQPSFQEFTGESPAAFVLSKNLHRRHLTQSQRAAIAVQILPHLEAEARQRQLAGKGVDGSGGRGKKSTTPANLVEKVPPGLPNQHKKQTAAKKSGKARDKAAQILKVNPRYISDVKFIEKTEPQELDAIQAGTKTVSQVMRELRSKQKKIQAKGEGLPGVSIEILNDQKFGVVYTEMPIVTLLQKRANQFENLLDAILDSDALVIIRSPLREPVPASWGPVSFLTCIVAESGAQTRNDQFNLNVSHDLLLVYTTKSSHLIPSEPVESLVKTEDPFALFSKWFPTQNKLVVGTTKAPEGWTLLPLQHMRTRSNPGLPENLPNLKN